MTEQEARKVKVGDWLTIGGDTLGFVLKVNRKSLTFCQDDMWAEREIRNLPFSGQWGDVAKYNPALKWQARLMRLRAAAR